MTNRVLLILLQVVGAVSIVPYPFILIANVMSIAAPGQTAIGASPFILLSIYPVIWIILDIISWRLIGRGATGWAFALSSIPALFVLAGLVWYASSEKTAGATYARLGEESRKEIEPLNPLVWKIKCTGGKELTMNGPEISIDEAIAAIEPNMQYINVPAGVNGTPLRMALFNLNAYPDGTPWPDGLFNGKVRLIRALVAHGAKLGAPVSEALGDMVPEFRLKLAMMEGPVTTQTENPFVWKILQHKRGTPLEVDKDDLALLNKPTKLHGTPLKTVLMLYSPDLFRQLVTAGAHLTPEEEAEPATATQLDKLLTQNSDLRSAYQKR